MIRITETRATVEVKDPTADIVYEEHSTRTIRVLGVRVYRKELNYKADPRDEKKKSMGFNK